MTTEKTQELYFNLWDNAEQQNATDNLKVIDESNKKPNKLEVEDDLNNIDYSQLG